MKRFYLLLAGLAAAAVLAAPASAATSTVTGTISAVTLSIVPAASAAFSLTLDGQAQTIQALVGAFPPGAVAEGPDLPLARATSELARGRLDEGRGLVDGRHDRPVGGIGVEARMNEAGGEAPFAHLARDSTRSARVTMPSG